MFLLLCDIESKLGMIIRARDVDGDDFAFFLFLEKGIQGLEKKRFHAGFSLRNLGVNPDSAMQIDLLVQKVVGAICARLGTGYAE